MKFTFLALFFASAAGLMASTVGTSPCSAGTVASYQGSFAPPSLGCSIGILDYSNFSYQPLQNAPLASNIAITPTTDGFSFSQVGGSPFTASGNIIQFAIFYNILIDPAPVIPGADTHLDPPVGNVSITEYFCNDSFLVKGNGLFCTAPSSTLYSLTVTTASPDASITFASPALLFETVGIFFTLDGTSGTASFDALGSNNPVIVPEPASVFLFGLLAIAGGAYKLRGTYKLKTQRKN